MNASGATGFSSDNEDFPLHFGEWLKRRRQELDLTQEQLAKRASCSVFAIRKMESGERNPSRQLARMLAPALEISSENHDNFIKAARGELSLERLASLARTPARASQPGVESGQPPINLPRALTPFIGREQELAALGQLLQDPQCSLLTIVGSGGIGKTRLAIELASRQKTLFPGGVYYAPLDSINSPEFTVTAIAKAFGVVFSGVGDPVEQLTNHLTDRVDQASLLLLDNMEHLLFHSSDPDEKSVIVVLLLKLLANVPGLKILTTSGERINLQEEWVFELQGLPIPDEFETGQFESCSSIALFLQRARQMKADFEVKPEERQALVKVCQLVDGMPLAIELAATWVDVLSIEEIGREITNSLDILSSRFRNVPERQRSIRAVFAHAWKMLSEEEREVLCRLAVFRGGFQRQAAEEVAGASLSILMSLLSKSLLLNRGNGRYDLHALIRKCSLERLRAAEGYDAACDQHLQYFVSLAVYAYKKLRSAEQAEWFSKIEQEHDNINAALEWAFASEDSPERVEKGLCLIHSIDRFWAVRGHILEGISWLKRGLQYNGTVSLTRARALRLAGWLVNHGNDSQTAINLLQESLAISKNLNEEICQADALDTLGDLFWRHGDFAKARDHYAESLDLYRGGGDPLKIGLSLASLGRLHVDYGYCQEAVQFLNEALTLITYTSDLRGKSYCLNGLGRLALVQGELKLASERFRQALCLNYELGHVVDLAECLQELAMIKAMVGDESRASLLWSAAIALQDRSGFKFPSNDPIYQLAPASWIQSAPLSTEWKEGEMMPLDQAVAFALEQD